MKQSHSTNDLVCRQVEKFPVLCGTRRFTAMSTTVRHLFLSWPKTVQSTPFQMISVGSILTLSFHIGLSLPSGLFPSGFPTTTLYTPSSYMSCPSHSCWLDQSGNILWRVKVIKLLNVQLPALHWYFLAPRHICLPALEHPQPMFFLTVRGLVSHRGAKL